LPDLVYESASNREQAGWNTYFSVIDGEENESGSGLLEKRLILFRTAEVAYETLSILLDFCAGGSSDDERFDGSFGSSCFQLGQEGGVDGFGFGCVEINDGKCSSSGLGRGLD